MEQSLQHMNAAQRLQIWSERIEDCRSSGMSVRDWCGEPDFIEISAVQSEAQSDIISSVQLGKMQVNIHASRDTESLRADICKPKIQKGAKS